MKNVLGLFIIIVIIIIISGSLNVEHQCFSSVCECLR